MLGRERGGDGGGGAAATADDTPVPTPVHLRRRPTLLSVIARVAENGYSRELTRTTDVYRDLFWARVVGEPCDVLSRMTRLGHWAREGDIAPVRQTLDRGARRTR